MNNKEIVYLAQTDTTVGFLSQDDKRLAQLKQRDVKQKTLQVVDSFETLKQNVRIPKNFRGLVRKSSKTTFIYPNGDSYRVVDSSSTHFNFISKVKQIYSTSANITGQNFYKEFAINAADIIIENEFCEKQSSSIIKITKIKSTKIR